MITAVAFCPQAPALVPAVGRGLDTELGPLREACRTAIRRAADGSERIVVVGTGPRNATFGPTARGSLASFGVDLVVPLGVHGNGPIELPPSLTVGAWLVGDALGPNTDVRAYSVADDLGLQHDGPPTALVVIGDGSARRSEKAPGYFDERAQEWDANLADGLRAGHGQMLSSRGGGPKGSPGLSDDLLVAGAPVWNSVADQIGADGEWDADLLYDDAPFGVGYFVAVWTRPNRA